MAGKLTQQIGAFIELLVSRELTRLRNRGQANVWRRTPPLRVIGKGEDKGVLLAVQTGEDCVDFEGMLKGGRRVAFDAKHAAGPRFDFSCVRDGQIRYLAEIAAWGGVALLYVFRDGEPGRGMSRYVLPVDGAGRIAGVTHKRVPPVLAGDAQTRESARWDDLDSEGWRLGAGESWAECVARQTRAGRWP